MSKSHAFWFSLGNNITEAKTYYYVMFTFDKGGMGVGSILATLQQGLKIWANVAHYWSTPPRTGVDVTLVTE